MANLRGPLPKATSRRGQTRARKAATEPSQAVVLPSKPTRATFHPSPAPEPPDGLGEAGVSTWLECWSLPWTAAADFGAILTLARLEDERSQMAAEVAEHGMLLRKVLTSARGDIVGEEFYPNPLIREMRRVDTALSSLRDRLGLTPLYRARLGLALVELEAKENAAVEAAKHRYREYGK
jgi:hypothetical protein